MKRLILVLCVLTLASLAFAQSGSLTPESAEAPLQFPPPFSKHTSIATYVSTGDPNKVIPAYAATPIDAVNTISCPGPTGTCFLQVNSWVQMGNGSEGDEVYVCLYLDGQDQIGRCEWGGVVQVYGRWVNVATSLNVPGLSVGNHTVQSYIVEATGGGVTLGYYNINYQVFKP